MYQFMKYMENYQITLILLIIVYLFRVTYIMVQQLHHVPLQHMNVVMPFNIMKTTCQYV